MALQYARPISDISTGSWSPTPLYASLEEQVATTTDRVASAAGVVIDIFEVALSSVTDPNVATGYKFRLMYHKDSPGGTSQVNLIVSVRQGPSVEIQSWTIENIPYEWTVTEFELGVTETDSISSHGSLRVRVTKIQV